MNLDEAINQVVGSSPQVLIDGIRQQHDAERIITELTTKETWLALHIVGALYIVGNDAAYTVELVLAGATNRAIPLNDIPDNISAKVAALLQEGAS